MPELPDIVVYIERLQDRVLDQRLEKIRLASPFLVRSFDPPIQEAEGKKVVELRRLGKRIIFCLESELFLIFHLMIAGRLRWRAKFPCMPVRSLSNACWSARTVREFENVEPRTATFTTSTRAKASAGSGAA